MNKVYRCVALGFAALILAGFASSAQAQSLETIHRFTNVPDGAYSTAGLIADAKGDLYGTTSKGGQHNYGAVFKLTPNGPTAPTAWTECVIHSFAGGSDGAHPYTGLVADAKGALYGTTYGGGWGYGVAFKLTPPPPNASVCAAWTKTVIHSFPYFEDGGYPYAGLIFDPQFKPGPPGALYGTTNSGGGYGYGTVFQLTPPSANAPAGTAWTETVLYSFTGNSDGAYPQGRLLADPSGALIGTTSEGGLAGAYKPCGLDGCGTLFKLTPAADGKGGWSWDFTLLHTFVGTDGATPYAGLTADPDGWIYGTTYYGGYGNDPGGPAGNDGTVFRMSHYGAGGKGTFETIYNFCGYRPYGTNPAAGVIWQQGAIYGTAYEGGDDANGTVFKLTPDEQDPKWDPTLLYSFSGGGDGAWPLAGLVADPGNLYGSPGALYGTTSERGAACGPYGCGTAFKLTLDEGRGKAQSRKPTFGGRIRGSDDCYVNRSIRPVSGVKTLRRDRYPSSCSTRNAALPFGRQTPAPKFGPCAPGAAAVPDTTDAIRFQARKALSGKG
jgi:uncharacterized repeat protein (TIGR03803 family)